MAFIQILSVLLAITIRFGICQDPGLAWIWPPPVGFNLSTASIAPCGGFNTSHDGSITYFLDQLRWNQTAASITYMTRVSRDLNAVGGWNELYPTIQAAVDAENAANNAAQFCVPIPEESDPEQTNVFQLIANTPLGIVFACSKVKFTRQADRAYPSTCVPSIRGNNTVTNTTDQSVLSAALLPAGATATLSSTSTSIATEAAVTNQPNHSALTSSRHLSGGAIAGIVVGSLASACALAFAIVFLLMRRRQKPAAELPKRVSVTSYSGSSSEGYDGFGKRHPSELPAIVPTELDSTARVELPTSEKDIRPELPPSEAGPLPEKRPIEEASNVMGGRDEISEVGLSTPRSSPTTTAVSPTTPRHNSIGGTTSPVSPVSPMLSRANRHFP